RRRPLLPRQPPPGAAPRDRRRRRSVAGCAVMAAGAEAAGSSDIDVWLLRPDACAASDLAGMLAWLAPSELERYHRFVFDRHRTEYLATRALVRLALSSVRTVEPAAWRFRTNAYGRPEIDPPD